MTREYVQTVICLSISMSLLTTVPGCREYPVCSADEDCVEYEQEAAHNTPVCIDEQCVQCRESTDCPGCALCGNNQCQALACCDDATCAQGQICESNQCLTGCRDDTGCQQPTPVCLSGQCVQCRDDAGCPGGSVCEDNVCVDRGECWNREFQTIYFDFDSTSIRQDQLPAMEHNLACLNEFPDEAVEIQGHTDERNSDAYNMALGERYADAVRDYLRDHGIPTFRMITSSFGESRPANSHHDESAWSQNRRAEIVWWVEK
jgi:peptidoglycan-associated lipoprotein